MKNNVKPVIRNVPISVETAETLLRSENYADCMAVYFFIKYTAKWQETTQPKCTVAYIQKGTGLSKNRVYVAKKELIKLGLVENIQRRNNTQGTFGQCFLRVLNYPKNTALPDYRSTVNHDTNAYSINNNINTISDNNLNAYNRKAQAPFYGLDGFATKPPQNTGNFLFQEDTTKLQIDDATLLSEINNNIEKLLKKEKDILQQQGITMKPLPAFSSYRGTGSKTFELLKKYIQQLQEGVFILHNTVSPVYASQYGDKVLRYRNMPIESILRSIFEMMERYTVYRIKTPSELRKNKKLSVTQFLYDPDTTHGAVIPSYFRCMHVIKVGEASTAPEQIEALKSQISAFGDEDISGDTCIKALFPNLRVNKWSSAEVLGLYKSIYALFNHVMTNSAQFNPRNRVGMLYRTCQYWCKHCDFYDINKYKRIPAINGDFMQKYLKMWLEDIAKG